MICDPRIIFAYHGSYCSIFLGDNEIYKGKGPQGRKKKKIYFFDKNESED